MKNHIDLFAGCGGLSLGLESAGFKLLLANELSPMAAETFAYNRLDIDLRKPSKGSKVYWVSSKYPRNDIANRLLENPADAVGLKDGYYSDLLDLKPNKKDLTRSLLIGSIADINEIIEDPANKVLDFIQHGLGGDEVDLVSGGPPCQSFSMAGLRNYKSERNQLPWEFAKFIENVQPKIALLENVSGILRAFNDGEKSIHSWFQVAIAFAKVGYVPVCLHINAKYVGTAQNRPRFILIALRKNICDRIVNKSKDKDLLNALENSMNFYDLAQGEQEPTEKSLHVYEVERDTDLFNSPIFSSLVKLKDKKLVSVKAAIDDLRSTGLSENDYVRELNEELFKNRFSKKPNKFRNHDLRRHSPRIESRFRLYQVMSQLPAANSKEISRYLSSQDPDVISKETISELAKYWLRKSGDKKIVLTSRARILDFLSKLHTKKHTQGALHPQKPAPATLSIPDDACHYHETLQRTLTVREMARIQSFPDWYEIRSKVTTGGDRRKFEVPQYTQIGNAVPPLLGVALGETCMKLLNISGQS
jgi:DNA (cytosine-5)-methyltransferase 1